MRASIGISPRGVARGAFGVALLLTGMSVFGHFLQFLYGRDRFVEYVRLFNLGGEANIPTWYASALLFGCALVLFVIGMAERKLSLAYWRHWVWIGIIFLFLSLDETAIIHDITLEKPIVDMFHPEGILLFPWVIPGWFLVLLLTLIFRRFVFSQTVKVRNLIILAAVIYLTGALVLEMVSAFLMSYWLEAVLVRGFVATLQEFGEMTGLVVFLYALLTYLQDHRKDILFSFSEPS